MDAPAVVGARAEADKKVEAERPRHSTAARANK
eukprot:CAMPEP_0183509590 /NCGR_PEP_ID=MMETSP0371-20130417/9710_2 /TAXON_ID=268820 /ORGANISM="Peridinium aciculiferum, Strain PAER-2" /LENGTH=32 /DNA_ID= /DNA_START= /DNA_END= /DNA_ORIENTATION=